MPQKLVQLENDSVEIQFEDGTSFTAEKVIWQQDAFQIQLDLNLEAAGVELTERGFIKVNEYQETTAEGVYALGDVSGEKN